ncbi:MAG: hypothetical protein INR72_19230 [Williamsia herbipolensis]|nr:hypothetical protein [Williamsia herbipolensis]
MTALDVHVRVTGWSVTAIPDDHPDRHLFVLEIEDMCNRVGGPSFRVGRRLGPHALCRLKADPRGLDECKHRPWCQWSSLEDATSFAKSIASTLAVIGDYDEDTEIQHYYDVAQAIELGELP